MNQEQTPHSTHIQTEKDSLPEQLFAFAKSLPPILALELLRDLAGFEIELSDQSKENLREANKLLKDHSIVFYSNHTAMLDTLVILRGIPLLPHLKQLIYPVAQKYAALNRDKKSSWVIAPLLKLGNLLRIVALPVPQNGDAVTKGGRNRMAQYRLKTAELLRRPGSALGVTPEATRGDSLQMTRFKVGIADWARHIADLYFVPIGLIPIPKSRKFEMVVGKPRMAVDVVPNIAELATRIADLERVVETSYVEAYVKAARSEASSLLHLMADAFGFTVAELLPPEMRGHYAENRKEDDE